MQARQDRQRSICLTVFSSAGARAALGQNHPAQDPRHRLAVSRDDDLALRLTEARAHGRRLAKVAPQGDHPYPLGAAGPVEHDLQAAVPGAVVHHDDLERGEVDPH